MRRTTFPKSKMNYFESFGQQRTWAPLAQGATATAPTTKENARHSRNWQSNSIIAIPKRSTVARSVCGLWDGRYRTSLARSQSEQWEEEEAG